MKTCTKTPRSQNSRESFWVRQNMFLRLTSVGHWQERSCCFCKTSWKIFHWNGLWMPLEYQLLPIFAFDVDQTSVQFRLGRKASCIGFAVYSVMQKWQQLRRNWKSSSSVDEGQWKSVTVVRIGPNTAHIDAGTGFGSVYDFHCTVHHRISPCPEMIFGSPRSNNRIPLKDHTALRPHRTTTTLSMCQCKVSQHHLSVKNSRRQATVLSWHSFHLANGFACSSTPNPTHCEMSVDASIFDLGPSHDPLYCEWDDHTPALVS